MKKIRYALALLAWCGVTVPAMAQECADLFPQAEGTVLKYVSYDRKDKVTGSSEMSLKEKRNTSNGVSVILASRYSDDKGEQIYTNEMTIECRDGILYMDAGKFLDPQAMSAYESMEVKVEADNLDLPLDAGAGTALEDGGVTAVVSSGGVKLITISVSLTDRKVEAREKVETPAGNLDCIKYTYSALSQIGFIKASVSGVEWYSPEYGTVRSESYNKNGKLTGYTVLESISH